MSVGAGATVRLLTPCGIGGIAVVELRGHAAGGMVRRLFRPASCDDVNYERGRVYYGHVVREGDVLDEVLLACVSSDDGDCLFEINCHGGLVPAEQVLEAFAALGAAVGGEAGGPGGATRRELERDLLEQLIRARTRRAADVLLVQLAGRLRRTLEDVAAEGIDESRLRCIESLRSTYDYGRRLVEPATVVITGAPNVGKSTLANVLVGRERSIVHHLPGTTRDAVTSVASMDGLPAIVVDTAGLREAAEEIEQIGVAKALESLGSCDLVLWVFDHSRPIAADEASYLDVLKDMTLIPVMNKIDLEGPAAAEEISAMTGEDVQRVCALTGRGVDALRKRIFTSLVGTDIPPRDAAVVTTGSVKSALDEAVSKHDRTASGSIIFDRRILE